MDVRDWSVRGAKLVESALLFCLACTKKEAFH